MICSTCSAENPPNSKFCSECGQSLAVACPNCGSQLRSGVKFCNECGRRIGDQVQQTLMASAVLPEAAVGGVTERRLVSVLFADLVGFTTLSESKDSEEVRELLSEYFDASRRVISRYGGVVEKFIGDAVMAVWGTPVAKEDDAERAVRAALDLVRAVSELGGRMSAPQLRARAGVLTGEATVNLAAQGEGMVVGDLVNTASRVQSVAESGSVYVGEATKRATEAAIAYEDSGTRQVKGKIQPLQLYRALRVVAGRAGLMKSEGLEAPFMGRDRELRHVKDLFHACAEDGKAHLVQVTGIAGIGKSRLAWEFFKYMDGLAHLFYWHRGRCLSYGEGVTYWALAEMVRGRAGIVEGEDPEKALTKLRNAIGRCMPDPSDRRFVEPRLAHLLGLEERQSPDKADLFAGWRLFFERLAEEDPVVMVFEDMQWADPSLVEFLDYLLDWSRNHPLFVMTLARPEALGTALAGTKRNATSIYLEPLPLADMEEMLKGFVPGLPADLEKKILERAEGVPLYAVETVRMLLDRGLLVQEGSVYRPAGEIEALDIPETLHALVAARLDGLRADERRLLQDASVLGKTFTVAGLAELVGQSGADVENLLRGLVRKEVLSVMADPRSPEHGQYGFLQDIVRSVTYATLPKRERKAKHLAAASYLERGFREDEIAEVLASHYLAAYNELPEADDAPLIRDHARLMLVKAGERAGSLAANEEAARHFERALELASEPGDRAELSEKVGRAEWLAGRRDVARQRLDDAVSQYEAFGEATNGARVRALLGEIAFHEGRLEAGISEMEAAYRDLQTAPANGALAALATELARLHYFAGNLAPARDYAERALFLADRHRLPDLVSHALNTKGLTLIASGRFYEAEVLLRAALKVAIDHDVPSAALRAYNNLAQILIDLDRYEEALRLSEPFLLLTRRVGHRPWELAAIVEAIAPLLQLGRWDDVLSNAELGRGAIDGMGSGFTVELLWAAVASARRGDITTARSQLDTSMRSILDSDNLEVRAIFEAVTGVILLAEGKFEAAKATADRAFFSARELFGLSKNMVKQAWTTATEAAFELDDSSSVHQYLSVVESAAPGEISPLLHAEHARFKARLAAQEGWQDQAEARFKNAAAIFREISTPFHLAVVLLEHAEFLSSQGRSPDSEQLLSEAKQIFTELTARPWIERVDSALSTYAVPG